MPGWAPVRSQDVSQERGPRGRLGGGGTCFQPHPFGLRARGHPRFLAREPPRHGSLLRRVSEGEGPNEPDGEHSLMEPNHRRTPHLILVTRPICSQGEGFVQYTRRRRPLGPFRDPQTGSQRHSRDQGGRGRNRDSRGVWSWLGKTRAGLPGEGSPQGINRRYLQIVQAFALHCTLACVVFLTSLVPTVFLDGGRIIVSAPHFCKLRARCGRSAARGQLPMWAPSPGTILIRGGSGKVKPRDTGNGEIRVPLLPDGTPQDCGT